MTPGYLAGMGWLRMASSAVVLIGCGIALWLLSLDDAAFADAVSRWYGAAPMPRYEGFMALPTRGHLILAALVWPFVASCVVLWPRLAAAVQRRMSDAWSGLRSWLADGYARLLPWERWWFIGALGAATVLRLWYAWHDPPMLDEALNWTLFAGRGPFVALSFYGAPNNHVGYTLLASCLGELPLDPLAALRIPAVVMAGSAQAALYLLLRRMVGAAAATLALVVAMAAPMMLFYDHLGRGYAGLVLAFTAAMGACQHWLFTGDRRALALLGAAVVGGIFIMPSFIYAGVAVYAGLLALTTERSAVLSSALRAVAATVVLYAPALIVSGVDALARNPWVRPIGFAEVASGWWPHVQRVFQGLMGLRFGFALGMAMLLAAALMGRHHRQAAWLAALVVAISLALPFVHGVLPFERTWIHLLVPLAIATAIALDRIVPQAWHPDWSIPMALALFTVQCVRLRAALPVWEPEPFAAARACDALRGAGPLVVGEAHGPLAVQVLFDHQRGRLPAVRYPGAADSQWSTAQGRTVLIGDGADVRPAPGDSLLFADADLGAIWLVPVRSTP